MAQPTPTPAPGHPAWCDKTRCIPLHGQPPVLHIGPRDTWTAGDDNTAVEMSLYGSREPFIGLCVDVEDELVLTLGAARDFARRILALADHADPDNRFIAPGIEWVSEVTPWL